MERRRAERHDAATLDSIERFVLQGDPKAFQSLAGTRLNWKLEQGLTTFLPTEGLLEEESLRCLCLLATGEKTFDLCYWFSNRQKEKDATSFSKDLFKRLEIEIGPVT
ncbi:MAG: hypothetical protein AAF514_09835, partial [Verrucomicrobiota bacterium]